MKKILAVMAFVVAGGAFAAEDVNLYYRVAERGALTAAVQKLANEINNPIVAPALLGAVKDAPAGKLFAIDLAASNPVPRAVSNAALLAAHPLASNELARAWISAACKRALEKQFAENCAKAGAAGTAQELDAFKQFADGSFAIATSDAGIDLVFSAALEMDGELAKSKAAKLSAAQLALKDVPDNAHFFAVENDCGVEQIADEQRKAVIEMLFTGKDGLFPALKKACEDEQSKAALASAETFMRDMIDKMPSRTPGLRSQTYAATDVEGRLKYRVDASGSPAFAAFAHHLVTSGGALLVDLKKTYSNETAFLDVRSTPDDLVLALDAAKLVKAAEVDDPEEAKTTLKLVRAALGGDAHRIEMRVKGDAATFTMAGSDFKDGKKTGRAAAKFAKCFPGVAARKDLSAVAFASVYTLVRNLALGVLKRGVDPEKIAPYEPILNQLPDTGDAGIGCWFAFSSARAEGAVRISYGEMRGIAALCTAAISYQMMATMSGSAGDDAGDEDADDDKDGADDAE